MPGHYLDTAQDVADRAARTSRANAAAQHGHDACRDDNDGAASLAAQRSLWRAMVRHSAASTRAAGGRPDLTVRYFREMHSASVRREAA